MEKNQRFLKKTFRQKWKTSDWNLKRWIFPKFMVEHEIRYQHESILQTSRTLLVQQSSNAETDLRVFNLILLEKYVLFDLTFEETKPVGMNKQEFSYKHLSLILAFWQSGTTSVPMVVSNIKVFKIYHSTKKSLRERSWSKKSSR